MFSSLRRQSWTVTVALLLTGVGSAPAVGADDALPTLDPAAPDSPTGPLPAAVLHDFSRPALSVAPSDWRQVNAGVSAAPGMPGMNHAGHAMPGQSDNVSATPGVAGHPATHGGAPASPASASGHEAMGHAMPDMPAPGKAADPHASHPMPGATQ